VPGIEIPDGETLRMGADAAALDLLLVGGAPVVGGRELAGGGLLRERYRNVMAEAWS